MTEDEAKTKWCPKVEHRGLGKCIASACMAWRPTDNEGGPAAEGDPEPVYKPAGFCGLAGRP